MAHDNFFIKMIPICSQEGTIAVKDADHLPPLRNPEILIGENDLTSLSYLHEPAGVYIMGKKKKKKDCTMS